MSDTNDRRIIARSSRLRGSSAALAAVWLLSTSACVTAEAAADSEPGSTSAVIAAKLRAGSDTVEGDVEISTQAEADALGCATVLDGSLSVRPAEPLITLPELVEVTGDVRIEVEDTAAEDFQPAEVVDLPELRRVGGSLRFRHFNGHYGSDVRVGLPRLSSLRGNLSLALSSFNTQVDGLRALESVAGNVDIEAEGDCYLSDLLDALTHVGGDLRIHAHDAGSSGDVLRALREVDGDVILESLGGQNPDVLDRLERVGGFLGLRNTYWSEDHFPALVRVAGPLSVEGGRSSSAEETPIAGGPGLEIGALLLKRTDLESMPLPISVRVAHSGAIAIEENARLCATSVDTFVAAQQSAGWDGALSVSDNSGECAP